MVLGVWGYGFGKTAWNYDRAIERSLRNRIDRGELGGDRGDETLSLTDEGAVFANSSATGCYRWGRGIEAIAQTESLILLYTAVGSAFVIPIRAFPSPAHAKEFVRVARAQLEACGGSPRMRELRSFLADRNAPCPACGYGLRGLVGNRCPECGTQVAVQDFSRNPTSAA